MSEGLTELLKGMSPEAREEAREKVIDLEAEILVREVKKALEQAGFKPL
ncbi:MAG: hypothetical protein OEY07_15570 [Gammaproteobacteria bacterium]|nr:hypothetical protein [Gammaproteobacteria bacterium]